MAIHPTCYASGACARRVTRSEPLAHLAFFASSSLRGSGAATGFCEAVGAPATIVGIGGRAAIPGGAVLCSDGCCCCPRGCVSLSLALSLERDRRESLSLPLPPRRPREDDLLRERRLVSLSLERSLERSRRRSRERERERPRYLKMSVV